ncbi:hypothetical protein [Acetanaerobacterium elongatum]|uniref:Uncharacterized protein n=1 Tax=Acetanaerobacterium elongatum TaxID=258515 RepID=A0A1G9YLW5_9FIRM|nr:hypothetical protein [Acetanaerobacterium elongatum]SDN09493.1 hypothetical protein SAMN05192585_11131 [Acetanaerobacterium elongatum]
MNTPYENLANAVILRAVEDYRKSLRVLSMHPYHRDALREKRSILRFFHSDWFRVLTNLDPELLVKRLDKEVAV